MRAAGYVRVSTQEQAEEGYSISEQSERIKLYCQSKGWNLEKLYIDGGYSGAKLERPAMQELISECTMYDMVVVYKLDRLSRSQKDTIYLIEDVFKKKGVNFVSMQENFDTSTPIGMAMIGIISVFAQLEREQIKERMQMGKTGKAKEGYWLNVTPPVGYRYVPKGDGEGHLEIDEQEAEQVRQIFRMFMSGITRRQIAVRMGKLNTNRAFYNQKLITGILSNPAYCGKIRWNGEVYEGKHEPIISKEDFFVVQHMLAKSRGRNYGKTVHLLTGIIYCGECGARMSYHCTKTKYKSYPYYKCVISGKAYDNHARNDKECHSPSFPADKIEQAVISQILKLKLSDIKEPKAVDNSRQIALLSKQINRAMNLYTIDGIDFETVKKTITSLTEKRRQLETAEPASASLEAPRRSLKSIKDILYSNDNQAKINAVRALVERVTVTANTIDIQFTFK